MQLKVGHRLNAIKTNESSNAASTNGPANRVIGVVNGDGRRVTGAMLRMFSVVVFIECPGPVKA